MWFYISARRDGRLVIHWISITVPSYFFLGLGLRFIRFDIGDWVHYTKRRGRVVLSPNLSHSSEATNKRDILLPDVHYRTSSIIRPISSVFTRDPSWEWGRILSLTKNGKVQRWTIDVFLYDHKMRSIRTEERRFYSHIILSLRVHLNKEGRVLGLKSVYQLAIYYWGSQFISTLSILSFRWNY